LRLEVEIDSFVRVIDVALIHLQDDGLATGSQAFDHLMEVTGREPEPWLLADRDEA
jgi:hypothetical protein